MTTTRRLAWTLLALGLALQLLLLAGAFRAWPSYRAMRGNSPARDSVQYYDLIWPFLEHPHPVASWKKSGTGADFPGTLLPYLWGALPLATGDTRTASFLLLPVHAAAGLLLFSTLARAAGERAAAFFLAVFWLSPWRLFHSAFVWEPNLLVLPAAAHLWCCFRSREGPRPLASFVLGATLVLTLQLHYSAVFLVLATAVLALRRAIRVAWRAFGAGALLGAVPLLPAFFAFARGTRFTGGSMGFFGRGFVTVLPVLRTLVFWPRLASLDCGRMHAGDCVSCARTALGSGPIDAARCFVHGAFDVVGVASIAVPLAAALWWRRRAKERAPRAEGERWLLGYAGAALAALLVSAGLAPITLQTWHVVIAAPAACLPVALWLADRWPFARRWQRAVVLLFLALRLPYALELALEYPAFQRVPPEVARALQD